MARKFIVLFILTVVLSGAFLFAEPLNAIVIHSRIPDFESFHCTLLNKALQSGTDWQQILTYLRAGVNLDHPDSEGLTPVMYAARYTTEPRIIIALSVHGADLNAASPSGLTPLTIARKYNPNPEIASVLELLGAR